MLLTSNTETTGKEEAQATCNKPEHKSTIAKLDPAAKVASITSPERVSSTRDHLSSSPSDSDDETDSEEESASETGNQEELYRELFGTSQFSEDSGDETLDAHERYACLKNFQVHLLKCKLRLLAPSSSNANQINICPSPEDVPQPGTIDKDLHIPGSSNGVVDIEARPALARAQEPGPGSVISSARESTATGTTIAPQPTRPQQHTRDKAKRKLLPRDDGSNFFGTPSPSPPTANSIAKGNPPFLLEEPYRSSLKRTRATSDNVNNDKSWPPKRRKKTVEDIDMVGPDVDRGDAHGRVEMKKAVPVTLPVTGSANGLTQPRPPAQVNAVASSSKALPPNPPHQHAKPPNLLKMVRPKGTTLTDTSHKNHSNFQTVANNDKSVPPDAVSSLPKAMRETLVIDQKKHDGHVARSSSHNPASIKPMHRLIATPDKGASLQLGRISPVDADDPFITNRPLDKGKNRASSPVRNPILDAKPPRRIDLRQSLHNRAIRRSSNLSSRTSTTSTSRHSVTSFLLPEDQEIINQVGFPGVMAVIAKNYGFDVDVAMNAFFATKSIEKTEAVLQHAKEVANSATSNLLAELVNQEQGDDVDSSGDGEPQSMRRGHCSSSGNPQNAHSERQKAKRSSGSRKVKRPSLNIKPQLVDEEIDALSDYSPPHVSRAGQFMRLVKQGRRKEAVDRERRRASGAFVAQTQTQVYDEDQRQRSLSLMPNSSPTPNFGQEEPMDICDDAFELPAVTSHKDTVQHQPPADVSLPVDDHRIFIKRISDGQSSLNEDEDDPAVVKLAQEHRDLVMAVTEENADALRRFEQKNNQDLLRLWSLDWVKQKIADM